MKIKKLAVFGAITLGLSLVVMSKLYAHCDALDGPVVAAAKLALQKGDVTPVLKWVNPDGEKEIRGAFALTMKVRSQGEEVRRLADLYFFETLVRVHRAGEGMPYTGLKPAGTIEPVVLAADQSLAQEAVDGLAEEIGKAVQQGIRTRFARALEKKNQASESVEAGRAYVEAYVDYVHYVEAAHLLGAESAGKNHQLHEPAAVHE